MKYDLQVLNKKLVMDSREIAELTHKQHKNVLADIRKMFEVTGSKVSPLHYKDKKGEMRPYYLLTYEDTILILTGYSVVLRQAVIKRWLYLENAYRKERQKSIEIRNNFTDELKDRGYSKQYEYIQTTNQMKKELSIEHKKESMTEKELKAVRTAEALASLMFDDEYGYSEVNPVCVEASSVIANAISNKKAIGSI